MNLSGAVMTGRQRRRTAGILLPLLLLVLAAQVAGTREQAPTGGRLRIDFRAVAADGTPARELSPTDVTVRLGGRARTVTAVEFFESARRQRSTPAVQPPYVTSDDSGPAADLYLAFDGSVAPDVTRAAVDALLDTLAPSDRVGLFRLRPGSTAIMPTHRHEEVRGAAAAVTGVQPGDCVAGHAADALVTLIRGRADAAPSAVLVFTTGQAAKSDTAPCQLRPEDAQRIEDAVRGRAVQLFFAGPGSQPATFDSLARATGGRTIALQPDPRQAMVSFSSEMSGFYVATIELESGDRDGATRPLQLEVTRPGITAAARSTVQMPPGGRPIAALQPRDMVRSGMPYRALSLRAAPYTSSNYDGRVKIVVLFEPEDPAVKLVAASLALFDLSGRLVAQSSAEDLQQRPAVSALLASTGRYRLRIAATDSTRRGGTVELHVDARLRPAGPLTLSGLILGGPDVLTFSPRLAFNAEPAATAYLEMYGVPPGGAVAVRFEIARTSDGPAFESMPAMLPPSSTPGRIATASIPIADLAPGDYVIRAQVSLDGTPVGSTTATLRKRH